MRTVNSKIRKWADQIGYRKTVSILFECGISARVSEMLAQGRYPRDPKKVLLGKIENAVKKLRNLKKSINRRKKNE